MSYRDDNNPEKLRSCATIRHEIERDIQQKLPIYFQEMVAARCNGRSANDITLALWPNVAGSRGRRLRP